MSGFEWVVVLLLCVIAAGLFSIARALRNLAVTVAEVAIGVVANVRAKPIAVTTDDKEATVRERDY
jgi:hypothetical protein